VCTRPNQGASQGGENDVTDTSNTTPLVTHREFKLLLKAEMFPERRAVLEFNELLATIAAQLGVRYEPVDSIDSQLRIVEFYDTKNEDLRRNNLIFRTRQIRQDFWPEESWELTFKCRAPEYDKVAKFDTDTIFTKLQKKKFKEELIRDDQPGTMRIIYSNNVIVEYPKIDPEAPLAKLAEALPHLKSLGLDLDQNLSAVAGAKVFEVESTLGTLSFGHDVTAHATLAAWARPIPDAFEILVAEFSYSTQAPSTNNGEKARRVADDFFKAIQVPLKDWLAEGTTKTALIYGN